MKGWSSTLVMSCFTSPRFSACLSFWIIAFLSLLLLASEDLLKRITGNRVLLGFMIFLLLISSLRNVYNAYPKSLFDPINAVEDPRIDPVSVYYIAKFLAYSQLTGTIATDYKTGLQIPPSELYFNNISQTTPILSTSVIFDINGLKWGSLYTHPEAYLEAYSLMLTKNVIYTSGNITVIKRG